MCKNDIYVTLDVNKGTMTCTTLVKMPCMIQKKKKNIITKPTQTKANKTTHTYNV